jgi:hypothetical protein
MGIADIMHARGIDGRKNMNWEDPIVEELHAIRAAHAAKFDYDLERMYADLMEKEKQDPWPKANLPPLARRKRKPVRTVSPSTAKRVAMLRGKG